MTVLMYVVAGVIYVIGFLIVRAKREHIPWHSHLILIFFGLSVGMQHPIPGINPEWLYSLTIGVIVGAVWVILYLVVLSVIKAIRRIGNSD